jgi:tRNA(adenine34) deaminase
MTTEDYIKLAMEEAEVAVREGNAPFGVVVTDMKGEVLWKDHDRVRERMDPTAHGEINAIRSLCEKMGTLKLTDTVFYTTSEPCPTCLSAMIKARVSKSVYGAKTEATASLPIPAEEIAKYAKKYPIEVTGGVLAEECFAQRERLLK